MRLRIGLDVDEVIAQLHQPWLDAYNEDYDDVMRVSDIDRWELDEIVKPECGKRIFSYLTGAMYDEDLVKPYPDALGSINILRSLGHSIAFVTSCVNDTAAPKAAWLERHDFLQYGDAYLPGRDKSRAPVDILVDDHVVNVNSFTGMAFLVNRPHNLTSYTFRTRVSGLAEFARIMIRQAPLS